MLNGRRILLVIGGGIAAYKSLELIRAIRADGGEVVPVMTKAAHEFVTPMSVAALAEHEVHSALFDLTVEARMGHIALSRSADLLLVCPGTADLLAKMAAGMADDLATTLILATDKPVLVAPAMNVRMWEHPATQANIATLQSRGVEVMVPDTGPMACGEYGPGRLPEPLAILDRLRARLGADASSGGQPLAGRHVLVTAGPTHEPIDPVRYLANRSSGKQGFAIAEALARLGARVTLVAGPVALPTPAGVERVDVETALQMRDAVFAALPADVAVMVAAVADWRVEQTRQKIKKGADGPPQLQLAENPDILAELAHDAARRPRLVIGFAAETEQVIPHAKAKLERKGADLIVANDVSGDVMGGDRNLVHLVAAVGVQSLPEGSKADVAAALGQRIAEMLQKKLPVEEITRG